VKSVDHSDVADYQLIMKKSQLKYYDGKMADELIFYTCKMKVVCSSSSEHLQCITQYLLLHQQQPLSMQQLSRFIFHCRIPCCWKL